MAPTRGFHRTGRVVVAWAGHSEKSHLISETFHFGRFFRQLHGHFAVIGKMGKDFMFSGVVWF